MTHYRYPLLLDVGDKRIVIVGGGAVAARKAAGLLNAGATRIVCIAPRFSPELSPSVERLVANYSIEHLEGAQLVFAATDSTGVNEQIVRDATVRGIWVCRADADETPRGNFITPAIFSDGPVLVMVSSSSAALSARIRDQLAGMLDRRFVRMADEMRVLRPAIRASKLEPAERAAIFRDLASDPALAALEAGGSAGLAQWLAARYPRLDNLS